MIEETKIELNHNILILKRIDCEKQIQQLTKQHLITRLKMLLHYLSESIDTDMDIFYQAFKNTIIDIDSFIFENKINI